MKNTLKVVLADDEALIRLDIREMLTEGGHEVAGEANNGEDAVAMTRALQPDLVIMDVKMPQMDGLTASKIITDEHLAPVLLLTAYSQQEIVSQAKSSGVLGYLVKPVRDARRPRRGGRLAPVLLRGELSESRPLRRNGEHRSLCFARSKRLVAGEL